MERIHHYHKVVKKTVIFVPHYKESFKTLLPIALHARNEETGIPHFVIYFSDDSEVKQSLENHGISFSTYETRTISKISESNQIVKVVLNLICTIGTIKRLAPSIERVAKLISDLVYSARLINRLSPVQAMVCAVETNEIEYALISVLNRKNINTVVVQWAQTVSREYYESVHKKKQDKTVVSKESKATSSMLRDRVESHIKQFLEKVLEVIEETFNVRHMKSYGDGSAKYFAVMGKYYEEMFCAQGVSKDKLVVTGHPEHDYLFKLSHDIQNPRFRQSTLKCFGLDDTKPLWILAREATAYFHLVDERKDKDELRTVCKIISKYHPDVQIVLKLHPRDSEAYYEFVRKEFLNIIVIHECDLYRLIAACDLYIAQISSTMMWAIALNKPVISYNFNKDQPCWHFFRDKEGITKVETPEELTEKTKAIAEKGLSPENYHMCQIAKRKYMVFDGRACERIVELMTKVAEQRGKSLRSH